LQKKPLNTFKGRLEYYVEKIFLKNSVVTIKLWLAKKVFVGTIKFHLAEYFCGFSLVDSSLYRKRFYRLYRKKLQKRREKLYKFYRKQRKKQIKKKVLFKKVRDMILNNIKKNIK
jgi:hypothetical protein